MAGEPKVFKALARDWQLTVNTGTEAAPVFTPVKGLASNKVTIDSNEVDVTDFDSTGWDDKIVSARSWALAFEGFTAFTKDVVEPTLRIYDPGQEYLRAASMATGAEAQVQIQLLRRSDSAGYSGWVNVNVKEIGGAVKDAEPFTGDLSGSGELVKVAPTP